MHCQRQAAGVPYGAEAGYFEITLFKPLLEGQLTSLMVGWIDFFRDREQEEDEILNAR